MPSKAQGLSLNAIIIALIVLVVLIILIAITTGYFGKKWVPGFNTISSTSCADAKGTVVDEGVDCGVQRKDGTGIYDDVSESQKCCLPLNCGESVNGVRTHCTSASACTTFPLENLVGCPSGKVCCAVV